MISLSASCAPRAELVRAKNIDYTPDVTSDAYWDTHHICVVRVMGIVNGADGKALMTYRVITQISEGPMAETRTVPLSDLWFGTYVEEPPRIAVNDTLVIYYAKAGPSPIVTTKLGGSDGSRLVNSLLQIASLRANQGGLQALSENVFNPDTVVALYSLKRLNSRPPFEAQGDYLARLIKTRDEEGRAVAVQLLASRLAYKLEGKPANSEEEYAWLRASMVKSKEQDWTQLRLFVERLLEFENKRAENVAFLVQLVRDQTRTQAQRIAAYGSFENPRLFQFTKPDAESEAIFNCCLEMLKDQDPVIRGAGAALLHNISVRIDSAVRRKYAERARAAISAAIAIEENDATQNQLRSYLKLISQAF